VAQMKTMQYPRGNGKSQQSWSLDDHDPTLTPKSNDLKHAATEKS